MIKVQTSTSERRRGKLLRVPTAEFLDNIERRYVAKYPRQYRELCAQLDGIDIQGTDCGGGAHFITDIEMFWAVNTRVGEQQWGDYERAIAGKGHRKDKNKLWGQILPFFFDADCVFGFSGDGSTDDQVHVWSVHTIVHSYPSLSAFMRTIYDRSLPS
jgi:hypothetical protein